MHKNSKTPCRHYDQQGRPASFSGCPKGNSCRFLHPNDPSWPRKTLSSKFQDGRCRSGDSASRTYRSTPLAPQSALFLLRKCEELSMGARGRDTRRHSDGGGKRDYSFICDSESAGTGRKEIEKEIFKFPTPSRNETPFRNYPASRVRRSNDEIDNSSREISPKTFDNGKKLQRYSDTSRTQEIKHELKGDLLSQSPGHFTKQASHSRGTASIFRDLARLSREVDNLSQVQRKEEENIQTYKKISTTLGRISTTAATTITPQLSRSLIVQADCKKAIEEKEKRMQKIWTDAVEGFVKDVTREIDVGLQSALVSIRQEARQLGRNYKRQRDDEDVEILEETIKKRDSNASSSEAITREDKRRRVSPAGLQDGEEGSQDEISEMKLKIEQQAQILAMLTQENNELRQILT